MRRSLDPKLDVVFKLLFGNPENKDVLIALLTAVLRPEVPIEDVEVLNPEIPKELVADKGIVLDLLVRLADGTLIDVEMQVDRRPGFRARLLFYWSRSFCSQIVRGDEYVKLRPMKIVTFLDYREREAKRLHSVYRLLEINDHEPFSDDLEIHLIELPKTDEATEHEQAEETDLVRWCRFLAAKTDEEMEDAAKEDEMVGKARDSLWQLSAKPSAQELARQRELAWATHQIEMQAAKEEGEAKGRAEGQRELLLRMIEKRFGSLTPEQQQQIAELDPERAIDRLLTAESLNELLDS